MNTMSVHDLHFDEDFLAFVGHDINSIGNVQTTYHGEPENPLVVDKLKLCMMITKMQLEILWKQRLLWKPHYCTSVTWAFLKVNNSQPMDLEHNQLMRCIIYQSDSIGLEILAMCTKCKKG
jgi:hypothetical protein